MAEPVVIDFKASPERAQAAIQQVIGSLRSLDQVMGTVTETGKRQAEHSNALAKATQETGSRFREAFSEISRYNSQGAIPFTEHARTMISTMQAMRGEMTEVAGGSGKLAMAAGLAGAGFIGLGVAAVGAAAEMIDLAKGEQEATVRMENLGNMTRAQTAEIAEAFNALAFKGLYGNDEMLKSFGNVAGQLQLVKGEAIDAAEATAIMSSAQHLSVASGASLEAATNAVSRSMITFKLTASDSERVADQLFNTSRMTGIGVEELANASARLSARMGIAKPSMEDMNTLMVELAAHGMQGQRAMLLVNSAIESLLNPSKEAEGVITALGLQVFDADGKFVGLRSIIEQLSPVIAEMDDKTAAATEALIFGAGAGSAMHDVLADGTDKWDTYNGKVNDAGTALDAQGRASETAAYKTAAMHKNVEELGQALGGILLTGLSRASEGIMGLGRAAGWAYDQLDRLLNRAGGGSMGDSNPGFVPDGVVSPYIPGLPSEYYPTPKYGNEPMARPGDAGFVGPVAGADPRFPTPRSTNPDAKARADAARAAIGARGGGGGGAAARQPTAEELLANAEGIREHADEIRSLVAGGDLQSAVAILMGYGKSATEAVNEVMRIQDELARNAVESAKQAGLAAQKQAEEAAKAAHQMHLIAMAPAFSQAEGGIAALVKGGDLEAALEKIKEFGFDAQEAMRELDRIQQDVIRTEKQHAEAVERLREEYHKLGLDATGISWDNMESSKNNLARAQRDAEDYKKQAEALVADGQHRLGITSPRGAGGFQGTAQGGNGFTPGVQSVWMGDHWEMKFADSQQQYDSWLKVKFNLTSSEMELANANWGLNEQTEALRKAREREVEEANRRTQAANQYRTDFFGNVAALFGGNVAHALGDNDTGGLLGTLNGTMQTLALVLGNIQQRGIDAIIRPGTVQAMGNMLAADGMAGADMGLVGVGF